MTKAAKLAAGVPAVSEPPAPARGRPRDPQFEERVFDAAIAVYAEEGWRGFNFDAVARRSGVGKAGVYRRWKTRGDLLRETLEARWYKVDAIDTGSLRGDLTALAHQNLRMRTARYNAAALQIDVDTYRSTEVRGFTQVYTEAAVRQARAIIKRAIERGELPANVNAPLILDVLIGASTTHVMTTPPKLWKSMLGKLDEWVDDLVSFILRGIRES